MRLYFKYLQMQLKTNATYKGSLIFNIIGQLFGNVATLFGIYLLFQKFSVLGEYHFTDIMLTYAIVLFVFSFDEMMFRGMDQFDTLIQRGEFDSMLLRPRNLVLQLAGFKIEIVKIGRVLLSLVVLIIACAISPIQWSFIKVLVLLEMVISGIITFFGIYLFTNSITIFTIKKAEFINVFTDGGRELCYYPLDVFKKFVTKFFTFIIPFASFNYIPLRYILGFADAGILNLIYPLISVVFTIIGYYVFNFCVRFYKSSS